MGKEISSPDKVIESIYKQKMVPLEIGDWGNAYRMSPMIPPRNDKKYEEWMTKLIKQSWERGEGLQKVRIYGLKTMGQSLGCSAR